MLAGPARLVEHRSVYLDVREHAYAGAMHCTHYWWLNAGRTVWLCITLGSLVGAAPANAASETRPPAEVEIASYAKEAGISREDAAARLGEQARVPSLTVRARRELGSAFGGVWIDVSDQDRIEFGVVADQFDANRATAHELLRGAGLDSRADVVPYAHSERELTAIQDQLTSELDVSNREAAAPVEVETDVARGRLRLRTPPPGTVEPSQREAVSRIVDRLGDLVEVETRSGVGQLDSCSDAAWCDPPLRGGIRLVYDGVGECSSGFVATSPGGTRYLMTAAHCFGGRSGTWNTHFADGSSHNIGAPHDAVSAPTGDAGILRINNPGGWGLPARRIRIQSDEDYIISDSDSATAGSRICFTGSPTDSNCAVVTAGRATRLGIQETYRADYCATGGDSGGSVFASHTAYGTHSGHYGSCDSVFYDMGFAKLWLNVDPARS